MRVKLRGYLQGRSHDSHRGLMVELTVQFLNTINCQRLVINLLVCHRSPINEMSSMSIIVCDPWSISCSCVLPHSHNEWHGIFIRDISAVMLFNWASVKIVSVPSDIFIHIQLSIYLPWGRKTHIWTVSSRHCTESTSHTSYKYAGSPSHSNTSFHFTRYPSLLCKSDRHERYTCRLG